MRNKVKKLSSALVIGLVLTIGITTMVGAKTVEKKDNSTTKICRMASVEPGEVPVIP